MSNQFAFSSFIPYQITQSPLNSLTCSSCSLSSIQSRQQQQTQYKTIHPITLSDQKSSTNIRPDAINPPPAFIPQTIEYSIRCAQDATKNALLQGHTYLSIELPMGRSRRHWYRMSPLDLWHSETSILSLHYAQFFKPLHIYLVIATSDIPKYSSSSTTDILKLQDIRKPQDLGFGQVDQNGDPIRRVIIIASATERQKQLVKHIVKLSSSPDAIILLNCFMDVPLKDLIPPFKRAYTCRALDKCALLQDGIDSLWSTFVEIAVFEYEWIGDLNSNQIEQIKGTTTNKSKQSTNQFDYIPTQKTIETFALQRGAKKKGLNGYWETKFGGCEAGFWPFMTAACRHTLPLDGHILAKEARKRAEKKGRGASRPFGFF